MGKNKIGGKKHKKGKNITDNDSKKLILKNSSKDSKDEEYACITKPLGNGRFEVICNDGKTRMASIRGKDRKRVFYNKDNVVLVQLWTDMTQSNKCSLLLKYSDKHINQLIDENHIHPKVLKMSGYSENTFEDINDDLGFDWDYSDTNNGDVDGISTNTTSYSDIYNQIYSDDDETNSDEETYKVDKYSIISQSKDSIKTDTFKINIDEI